MGSSSLTRDRTPAPLSWKQSLGHWTMREVPISYLFSDNHSDWREVIDILFRLWQVYTLLEEDCLGACVCVYQRRRWHPTPSLLPGKSNGRRSLVGCSPWGLEESDTTEQLHFHFSLSRNGEGNGNPLQCSCLENPRDGGAWWAAVYGVAQSWTRLKRLSSSVCVCFLLSPGMNKCVL